MRIEFAQDSTREEWWDHIEQERNRQLIARYGEGIIDALRDLGHPVDSPDWEPPSELLDGGGEEADVGEDAEPIKAAGVMFRTPKGEVLFVERSPKGDHSGEWALPGGRLDGDESAEEAAAREAEEEVGYYPNELRPLHHHVLDGIDFTTYICDVDEPFEPKINDESSKAAWYSPDKAPQPLHPGVAKVLAGDAQAVKEEKRDRSTFLYMEPRPDIPDHAQCSSCHNNLIDQGRCFWLSDKDEIDADDTCAMYGQGEPQKGTEIKPTGQYTPEELGFFSGKVQCQRCNAYDDRDKSNIHCDLYVQLNRTFPRLWGLDEKIKPRGCCNAWGEGKRDPKRFGPYGPIPDPDDPTVGGLITKILPEEAQDSSFDGLTVDSDHDGPWMSCMSRDGRTMYRNKNVPEQATVGDQPVSTDEILLHHEVPEWEEIQELLAAFKTENGREPRVSERKQIYLKAHHSSGTPSEREYCKANNIDWDKWSAWCRGQEAKIEKLEPTNPPPDADVRPFPHYHSDLEITMDGPRFTFDADFKEEDFLTPAEKAGGTSKSEAHSAAQDKTEVLPSPPEDVPLGHDSILAMDRGISSLLSEQQLQYLNARQGIAFDRSMREYDAEGRLHIARTPISKANICPYIGYEIPDWEELGLDPNRIYQLFRDPEELAKAAPTFNGIQVLRKHVPVSVDDHKPYDVVGATGTDAEFQDPYLYNSMTIWAKEGVDGVEDESKVQISSAYRYKALMEPGTFRGEHFDGRMTQIFGNHCALVEEGRAGGDVAVADSALKAIPKPRLEIRWE